MGATTMPDVVELEHIKVRSTTLFAHGLVTVRGFEGHADWSIDPQDDAAFTEMLRVVGKVTNAQRMMHGAGARAVIFLVLGGVTVLLALVTRWMQGMLN